MTTKAPTEPTTLASRAGKVDEAPGACVRECRAIKATELRAVEEGGAKKITGYAAVFNSPSEDFGGWVEVIKPGAFKRALAEKQDVRCLFNHDPSKILGRSAAGTLTLAEDSRGLRFECTLPDTPEANGLHASVKRGDISQCSFSFTLHWPPEGEAKPVQWVYPPDGFAIREVLDVDLYDVGPVTFPAYLGTEVQARDILSAKAEIEKRAKAEQEAAGKSRDANRRARLRLAEVENGTP